MRRIFSICSGLLVLCLFQASSISAQSQEIQTKKGESIEIIDRMIADTVYNLAMSEVVGYKQRETGKKGIPDPNGEGDPDPVRIYGEQGPLIKTGRSLDIAVQGAGFIRVEDGRTGEIIYTRYGSLEVTPDGNLCLVTGNVVRLLDPQVAIPEGHFHIDIKENGEVWTSANQNTETQQVGHIHLSTFISVTRLKPLDEYFFAETKFSGPPADNTPGLDCGVIKSGFLEKSNVDVNKMQRQLKRLNAIRKSLQMNKKNKSVL